MCLELRVCDDTLSGGKEILLCGTKFLGLGPLELPRRCDEAVPGGDFFPTPWNCLVTATGQLQGVTFF